MLRRETQNRTFAFPGSTRKGVKALGASLELGGWRMGVWSGAQKKLENGMTTQTKSLGIGKAILLVCTPERHPMLANSSNMVFVQSPPQFPAPVNPTTCFLHSSQHSYAERVRVEKVRQAWVCRRSHLAR